MKKSHRPCKFCTFFSLPLFKKLVPPPTQFFAIFSPHLSPPPLNKRRRLETMCIHLKISEKILALLLCYRWNVLIFFECFYCCLPFLMWFFVNIFTHFYDQIKHKAGNRFYPPTNNNKPMKTLQTKQPKGLLSFCDVKIFGWFTHIGCKRTRFRISCISHGFMLRTI